jgi:hypothetical protein
VYQNGFLTNNPNVNLYLLPSSNSFNLNVATPGTFWLVLSAANAGEQGTYAGTIGGPGTTLINELPAPVFAPQPAPTNQFHWPNEDPAPIIGGAIPADAAWSWFAGVDPGVPVDGRTNIAGLNTPTNDQPASVTARPTNMWFWARIDGAYGYDDSDLTLIEVSPPPRFMNYPASRSIVYGTTDNQFTTTVTNIPFFIRWFQGVSPNPTNEIQAEVIQGFGSNYIRAVSTTNNTPLLNVGRYSYWLQATNPSGLTNGATFFLSVTQRPLTVLLSIPASPVYDGLPHPASATAFDPDPGGPPLPDPLPIVITYKLGTNAPATNAPVNAGSYLVVATVKHSNYIGSASGTLNLDKRPLTVRAANKARPLGAANPPFTLIYIGFATNGENASVLDVLPTASTSATVSSPVGQYAIVPSGGSDNNYSYNFVNGTLTVLGEPVVVVYSSDFSSKVPAIGAPQGSASISNDVLQLTTTASSNQSGRFDIASPGRPLRGLHVEFDLLIGEGTGGEGFSFNYGGDLTNVSGLAEEGLGTGLSMLVDTHDNGGETVPNIGVRNNGSNILESVQTTLRSNGFNHFVFDVFTNGTLTLRFNSEVLFNNLSLGSWSPLPEWSFSIAARTTTFTDNHWLDNLLIGEHTSATLLSTNPPPMMLTLAPAFGYVSNLTYVLNGNSNPALAGATVASNGLAGLSFPANTNGSSVLSFNGSNATVNASVPFTLLFVQPTIVSVGLAGPGISVQISGPANAHYYLLESDTLSFATWQTVAFGTLDGTGLATANDTTSAANTRYYRAVFVE